MHKALNKRPHRGARASPGVQSGQRGEGLWVVHVRGRSARLEEKQSSVSRATSSPRSLRLRAGDTLRQTHGPPSPVLLSVHLCTSSAKPTAKALNTRRFTRCPGRAPEGD